MSNFLSMADYYHKQSGEKDFREPLRSANTYIKADVKRRFASEQAPDGTKWAAHSAKTIAQRDRRTLKKSSKARKKVRSGGDLVHKLLQDTGALRQSFQTNNPDHVEQLSMTRLLTGSQQPLAAIHQNGTTRAGRNHKVTIPARPMLGLANPQAQAINEIFGLWWERRHRKK